jgi:hypothetical protein
MFATMEYIYKVRSKKKYNKQAYEHGKTNRKMYFITLFDIFIAATDKLSAALQPSLEWPGKAIYHQRPGDHLPPFFFFLVKGPGRACQLSLAREKEKFSTTNAMGVNGTGELSHLPHTEEEAGRPDPVPGEFFLSGRGSPG